MVNQRAAVLSLIAGLLPAVGALGDVTVTRLSGPTTFTVDQLQNVGTSARLSGG